MRTTMRTIFLHFHADQSTYLSSFYQKKNSDFVGKCKDINSSCLIETELIIFELIFPFVTYTNWFHMQSVVFPLFPFTKIYRYYYPL